jgi:hypothetical protein
MSRETSERWQMDHPKVAAPRWHLMTAPLPLSLREGFLKLMAQLVWYRCPALD